MNITRWDNKARFGIIFVIMLLGISLVITMILIQPKRQEKEIGEYVVDMLVMEQKEYASMGGRSPAGSIFVQYSSKLFMEIGPPLSEANSTPYLSAWKYDGSQIRTAEKQEIIEGIDKDVFWVFFTVRSIHREEALVDVTTIYPNRVGGYASHRVLTLEGDQWVLKSRYDFFFWD
ncbi:MAG: hypothetical protein H6657_06420 [Ardenticatenaceae bacterium]|nr:hypothetical protein [Ardenticatenaceae bacterium]